MTLTRQQLSAIMPLATPALVDRYYQPILDQTAIAGIDASPRRMAHFLTQIGHETGDLHAVEECLNYSADGLVRTWPSLFNKTNAVAFARKPEDIANMAYGGRYGNGGRFTGDGWRFRGRGLIQLTFRGNYAAFEKSTGIPVVSDPDIISRDPEVCVRTATWYWTSHNLNPLADNDNLEGIRKAVNGGLIGIEDCKVRLARAKQVLGII